jgi:hypothetical protein
MNAVSSGTTVVDIWAITASATIPFWLEEIRLDPVATAVAESKLSIHLFSGAFTAGSGGTTITPVKTDFNATAAGATAKVVNTTQTTGGTNTVADAGLWNVVNGWVWQPIDMDHRLAVPMSGCIVLSLDTAFGTTTTMSGCAIIREMF